MGSPRKTPPWPTPVPGKPGVVIPDLKIAINVEATGKCTWKLTQDSRPSTMPEVQQVLANIISQIAVTMMQQQSMLVGQNGEKLGKTGGDNTPGTDMHSTGEDNPPGNLG